MSKIKKTLALLLAVVMTIGMMTMPTLAAGTGDTQTEPSWPNEGAIKIDKDYSVPDYAKDGEYEITLEIQGKNFKTTSDVVLVIDCSGSMEGKKLTNTREAAKAFGEKLLTEDSSTRIAIVTYDKTASKYNGGHFYTSNELNAFNAAIDDATYANGGTNQQAGIHAAREILNSAASTGKMKNIVILSDGKATYSYRFTANATYSNCEAWTSIGCPRGGDITDVGSFTPDYTAVIGDGSNFDLDSNARVIAQCPKHGGTTRRDNYIYDVDGTYYQGRGYNDYTNNGVATIWEANQAKTEGTKIFSVALQAGTNGEATLKACASDSTTDYFAISKNETDVAGKLTNAFTAIAGSIAIAARDGVVTDPMGEDVALVIKSTNPVITTDRSVYESGNADIYISQGTATWDADNETIEWNVGDIREGTPAEMSYKIKVTKENAQTGEKIKANGRTTFDYINYEDVPKTGVFPIPEIPLGQGKITAHYYAVNEKGEPINRDGVVVKAPEFAYIIQAATEYVNDYGTHTVNNQTIDGYVYKGYTLDKSKADFDGNGTSVNITTSAAAPNEEVWFAYMPAFKVVHVQNAYEPTVTTHYAESGFNLTSVVSDGFLYGGAFNNAFCGANDVQTFAQGENATSFTPKAGETYYIWEVSDKYLMPKSTTLWNHVDGTATADAGAFFMTAAIDRLLYNKVGFDAAVVDKNGSVTVTPNEIDVDWVAGSTPEPTNIKVYDKVEITKKNGKTETLAPGDKLYNNVSGYLICYEVAPDDWKSKGSGTQIVFSPYWITLDGVKVKGSERTCEYLGVSAVDQNGNYYITKIGEDVKPVDRYEYVGVESSVSMLRAFSMARISLSENEEPITPKKDYLTVKYFELGWFRVYGMTLLSAIDNEDYQETGFIINGAKYSDVNVIDNYGIGTARLLFGENVARDAKLMKYDLSLRGYNNGETIEVTPYWVTSDGNTVEGTTRTFTYYSRGIKG